MTCIVGLEHRGKVYLGGDRITLALQAAERFSAGVSGPFTVVSA